MTAAANMLLKSGQVFTMDQRLPQASAVAIRGNEILAVGKDDELEGLINPETQVIDLEGRLVLPGFNDAHTHYIGAALTDASTFSLYGVTSLDEAGARLVEYARQHPKMDWLHGRRLDLGRFEGGTFPTSAMLDRYETKRPVAITDIDGHSCWVNSRALELLGVDAGTPDPVGGQILRDAGGAPTGLLLENAAAPVPETELPAGMDFRQVMLQADLAPALRLRERLQGNEMVRMVALKTYIDGVISSRSAWLLETYSDMPGHHGFPMMDIDELSSMIIQADKAGFQVITHAIGDRAVRETLDIYQQAGLVNGRRDSRHRIEHIEMAHAQDQPRFAQLGVIAGMQPLHCTAVIDDYLLTRIGPARSQYAYTWRAFVNSGAHLCFGTDWPAIDMQQPSPLENIYGAVTRIHPSKPASQGWHTEQCLTLAQAIRAYTLESAYAEFMEGRKGLIQAGKLADLCVLDRDIFAEPPDALLEAKVELTVMDGRVVYRDF